MMSDMRGEREPAQLVIHNDDDTPGEFVIALLRQVFGNTADYSPEARRKSSGRPSMPRVTCSFQTKTPLR